MRFQRNLTKYNICKDALTLGNIVQKNGE